MHASVSSSTLAAQPVPDPWWESLTPAQQAETEEARAEVRREQRSKRTRKRKRKKKAPRFSSYSSRCRARRRHRQWHVPYWFPVSVLPTSVDDRAKMLDIMAGMDQEGTYMLVGFSLRPLVSGSLLFAVLFGSTLDTYYVSLQRLLWEIA